MYKREYEIVLIIYYYYLSECYLLIMDTVACKSGFTFTTGTKVLLRHTYQGFLRTCLSISDETFQGNLCLDITFGSCEIVRHVDLNVEI
jgi:hypothetical protein